MRLIQSMLKTDQEDQQDIPVNIIMKKDKLNKTVLILITIIGGIIGFIYETIFYKIDLGYFIKRGSTFGPWIPIYAFGSLFIALFIYPKRKNKIQTMLLILSLTTFLEYTTGYILYEVFHIRLWDYNTEILNYGNINGYICLRSILLFTFAGMILIYNIIPIIIHLEEKDKNKLLKHISNILISIFTIDIIAYQIINYLKK